MKAKLPKKQTTNARYPASKHNMTNTDVVVAIYKGDIVKTVRVIWYTSQDPHATALHCSVWIRSADARWFSGQGQADGGVSHEKPNAAFQAAIDSANVMLTDDQGKPTHVISAGRYGIQEAMLAIARAAGYRGKMKVF